MITGVTGPPPNIRELPAPIPGQVKPSRPLPRSARAPSAAPAVPPGTPAELTAGAIPATGVMTGRPVSDPAPARSPGQAAEPVLLEDAGSCFISVAPSSYLKKRPQLTAVGAFSYHRDDDLSSQYVPKAAYLLIQST